jgi:hypothetical protein
MDALLNPFFWFAVLVAAWGLVRLAGWMSHGGRLPLRNRRGTASGFGAAGLAAQLFYQPGAKQVMEAKRREEVFLEQDDEGDPPKPGSGQDAAGRPTRLRRSAHPAEGERR